jgi:SAM-dependent methyltransferase
LAVARHLPLDHITVIERSPADAARLRPRWLALAADPSALPFTPFSHDHVVVAEVLADLPPRLCLAEFARVLRPGGRLSVLHTARDDSVPWVRRLGGLVRQLDPTAMTGSGIAATAAALNGNHYFGELAERRFRIWVPAALPQLLAMVAALPGVRAATASEREALLAEVEALYETSARPPEPLLLPYTLACWRAVVDHAELTAPVELAEEGLRISL